MLVWADGWELRDLGSRNGTTLNGVAVPAGQRRPVQAGSRLGFGGQPEWEVLDVEPPSAGALCGDQVAVAEGALLGLPSLEDPVCLLQFDPGVGWIDEGGQSVQDGSAVTVNGKRWLLHLPEVLAETREVRHGLWLQETTLHFRVSSDEEYVEIGVAGPGGVRWLPGRAHHYMGLTLARLRLNDLAEGASEEAAGWVHTERLQTLLRVKKNHLYVAAHRLKKDLETLGLQDSEAVVERRRTSQQLRFGTHKVEISTL